MSQENRAVFAALERWEDKGLLTEDKAEALRRELVEASQVGAHRLTQYLLAATAAAVLLIAAGVFLDWAWPLMSAGSRSGLLAAVGIGIHLWGGRLEVVRRWVPAGLLMQVGGLGLVLTALVYSEEAWSDASVGGVATGVAALVIPLVLAPRAFRNSAVMPAVHLCFGFGFLAVFLDRATPLASNQIVWALDVVLGGATLVLVRLLAWDPAGQKHPWALNGFVAALYAAFVLVTLTGLGPLELDEKVVYPLDVWLLVVVCLTLWGIHRAPPGLRRDWFEDQLALSLFAWIPLGFFTSLEVLDGPPELVLVLVGGAAIVGFVYASHFRVARVMWVSALAFVLSTWYWGVERAGALGAVLALALTAALLFWVSGRASKGSEKDGRGMPG